MKNELHELDFGFILFLKGLWCYNTTISKFCFRYFRMTWNSAVNWFRVFFGQKWNMVEVFLRVMLLVQTLQTVVGLWF